MNPALDELQHSLVGALARHVDMSGTYRDAHTGRPSPSDHYGHCSVALALACLDDTDWSQAMRPVRTWCTFTDTQIGHLPFNRLLLNLLRQVANARDAPADDRTLIGSGIARCTLGTRYPSNNWTLLAQTCRLIEADDTGLAHARDVFCSLVEKWTTPAGGFIDYPDGPKRGQRVATPIAYHHKAVFLATLAARLRPHPDILAHVRRMLDWLVHCWDPAGYAGGLGRSSHALFGDACLIGALVLLGRDDEDPYGPVNALVRRIERQQRDDGMLWLDPAGPEHGDAAWDSYMHLSVYNAWMAAVIGICRRLGPLPPETLSAHDIDWRAARTGRFMDDQAGLLCLRTDEGTTVLISTRGQLPQGFSRDEVELRYAGGVVFHLVDASGTPRVAAPRRIASRRLLEHPSLAGWTPVFHDRGRLYGLTDFEVIESRSAATGVGLVLSGYPVALTRPAESGLGRRLLGALDWRFLGGRLGRRSSQLRPALTSVSARLTLEVSLNPTLIETTLELDVSSAVRYLNPFGHQLIGCRVRESDGAAPETVATSLPDAHPICGTPLALQAGRHWFHTQATHDGERWRVTMAHEQWG